METPAQPSGPMTPASVRFLQGQEALLGPMSPRAIAERVRALVDDHEVWRRTRCLNMVAGENTISRSARRLLDSDLATRVTEGFPGDKQSPPDSRNRHIDQIEATIVALAKRLFRAAHVEWRAVGTSMANAIAFFALTQPGDAIVVHSLDGGGNASYHPRGSPRLRGLRVHEMPPLPDFGIDVDRARALVNSVKPSMVVVGGSYALFPYPVTQLAEIAREAGARLLYDAAHLGVLIAAGHFQDPLADGADLMSVSTHKVMGGPIGGLALTNDTEIARRMLDLTFPSFVQARDQNRYAAAAYALAETLEFGPALASQMVVNAKALATALDGTGFVVVAKARGFTETHQVFLELGESRAAAFAAGCAACNILVHQVPLIGDRARGVRTGARLSVQELTRRGMRETEMARVAGFIRRAATDGEPAERLRSEIQELLEAFPRIEFSFDD